MIFMTPTGGGCQIEGRGDTTLDATVTLTGIENKKFDPAFAARLIVSARDKSLP